MARRRLLWLIIILIVLALYFPINRLAHGGVQLSLPIDKLIPLYPPAVIPYLLGDILFIGFPIWAAFSAQLPKYRIFLIWPFRRIIKQASRNFPSSIGY